MFNNIDEARTELHVAVGIIDDYVRSLNLKDATILRLTKENDELKQRIKELEYIYDVPMGGEVSE